MRLDHPVRLAHHLVLVLFLCSTACGGDDDSGPDPGGDGDGNGGDGSGSIDAAPPAVLWVSACFGLGCPRGECASLDSCDALGYNGGEFDFEDSNQFCGAGDPVDLCMEYDGIFYQVACAGLTVVRETCTDGCAFDEIVECAYCAEDPSCADGAQVY